MIYVEIPLWLVIVVAVCLTLSFLYFMVGDFLGKVLAKKLKEEEIEWATKTLTEDKGEIVPLDEKELENDK